MFKFKYTLVSNWPPLAWIARCLRLSSDIEIFHGSKVEITDEWFCEAVWAGDYESGSFDFTDIVAGSGCRKRNGVVVFVSSGSTVDCLHFLQDGNNIWISNSLCCLLSIVDGYVDPCYPRYHDDFDSIVKGIDKYNRVLNTSVGLVNFTYFDNLLWDGYTLSIQPKPSVKYDFSTFTSYLDFLKSSMQILSKNMDTKQRKHPYKMMSTLSNGYDSPTVTVLAKQIGCCEAISFVEAREGGSDSGEAIAKILGIHLHPLKRDSWKTAMFPEVPFIACSGNAGDVLFKGAEEYLVGKVLLTGFHGDKIWDKLTKDLSENIVRGDGSGMGLMEYRLWIGFIHCPVPFFGVRQIRDINAISNSFEMKFWDISGNYNRPICRRIVEEAGVPRAYFGIKKHGVSVLVHKPKSFWTPYSKNDYQCWLKKNRGAWLKRRRLPPFLWANVLLDEILSPNVKLLKWGYNTIPSKRGLRRLKSLINKMVEFMEAPRYVRRYTFPWAIEQAKKRYPRPF